MAQNWLPLEYLVNVFPAARVSALQNSAPLKESPLILMMLDSLRSTHAGALAGYPAGCDSCASLVTIPIGILEEPPLP